MARQTTKAEITSFVRGLITEASPLTFPEDASLDEDNFVLKTDGSRERRLGIDYEEGYSEVETGVSPAPLRELAFSAFSWKNVGGEAQKTIVVVQAANTLDFFDGSSETLSRNRIHREVFPGAGIEQVFSYTVVDGLLVVTTGSHDIYVFEYDHSSDTISFTKQYLKIRDLFGVEDFSEGRNLYEGQGIAYRPLAITGQHVYNLRNQTWATIREAGTGSARERVDPIPYFSYSHDQQTGESRYPSNADNLLYALYPNAQDESNRTGDQFWAEDLVNNAPGIMPAPKGYFVIDALRRGVSRLEEAQKLHNGAPEYEFSVDTLPVDVTPGGATCVAEYAGRVWYAGFSGEVITGDNKSPRMSSYVLYSKLVQDPTDINLCYQEGDPTSKDAPDLVDTDGGFIRVDGAYNIQKLVNIGVGIAVVAENGIWIISGGSGYGFTATNNMRKKITDNGAISPGSVVVVDNTFVYWANDGIYHVAPNKFGDYEARNLTQTTIQTFYDSIDPLDKKYCQGFYDSYQRKVRWVYQNRITSAKTSKELILDFTLGAFYTSTTGQVVEASFPKITTPLETQPFSLGRGEEEVLYLGEPVTNSGEPVVFDTPVLENSLRETLYLTITGVSPLRYTFSSYRDPNYVDWFSENGVGVDAPAHLITGYLSGGDFMREKQVPYIYFYFTRTEDGFSEDSSGNLFPSHPSSCKVQAQWSWANSANSNRWGREFEAYRYRRLYSPSGADDPFDNGFEVLTTKNKLRGHGRVLSLKISTSPGKDCKLLGWSMLIGVTGNV